MNVAICSWFGPVQYACGITSPKTKTRDVEIRIAAHAGTSASKKIGRDSIHPAFANSKVASSKWCSFRIGSSSSAICFSLSDPAFCFRAKSSLLIDNIPTVSPEQIPAEQVKAKTIPAYINHPALHNGKVSSSHSPSWCAPSACSPMFCKFWLLRKFYLWPRGVRRLPHELTQWHALISYLIPNWTIEEIWPQRQRLKFCLQIVSRLSYSYSHGRMFRTWIGTNIVLGSFVFPFFLKWRFLYFK